MVADRLQPDDGRMGHPLFDNAHHGNASGAGGAISVTTVGAGETAMMKQTSLDGLKLTLRPAVLAVSPDKLTMARQFVTTITPHQASDVNPFVGQITVGTGFYPIGVAIAAAGAGAATVMVKLAEGPTAAAA